ncbi:hypothetical protein [Bradyrhizobium sp. NP1]|nr:hypothetical protein [Bradyrhizobium sp. NP1]WJR81055.1 hypothetical protein QOU61_15265 [Bradyrhizobium sp. NP1]
MKPDVVFFGENVPWDRVVREQGPIQGLVFPLHETHFPLQYARKKGT